MNRKSKDSGSQKYCREWCEGLLKKHGDKILKEPSSQWAGEEIVDHYLYKLFSRGLNHDGLSYEVVLDERNNIVKKYGSKIYNNPTSEWTQEEIAAHNLYKVYSNLLHEIPKVKELDLVLEFFHRNEIDSLGGWLRYFFKYAKKLFWIVFLIAIFFAVIKYLLQ